MPLSDATLLAWPYAIRLLPVEWQQLLSSAKLYGPGINLVGISSREKS